MKTNSHQANRVTMIGQDFNDNLRSTPLGRHMARIGVVIAHCSRSVTVGDQPLWVGLKSMTPTMASSGANPMNMALYHWRFLKPTDPSTHCPGPTFFGHSDMETGLPFMSSPTMRCSASCTKVPGSTKTIRIAGIGMSHLSMSPIKHGGI